MKKLGKTESQIYLLLLWKALPTTSCLPSEHIKT
ncbi:Uncharacterised protein [Segatella copri]|nr:Uncharacterised protein [Segatella copri]